MADEVKYERHHEETKAEEPCGGAAPKAEETVTASVESGDRGLFGFGGKKEEEKCEETAIAAEFEEKVQVCEEEKKEEETKHEGFIEKLHRSHSSSSSSSDVEVEEGGEKKKKKKKEKKKEENKAEVKCEEVDTSIPIEIYDDVPAQEEKKGFLDKIKEKFPGGKKTEEVVVVAPPAPPPVAEHCGDTTPEAAEGKEKKGFLDKIKEKLPGYHSKSDEEKEKEIKKEEAAC